MSLSQPHPDSELIIVNCAVITISDTRTVETDRSGQLIQKMLTENYHKIAEYVIVKDDPKLIANQLKTFANISELDAMICNGGTGIAPRDTTYDALAGILEKTLPGFGEIFRHLSYEEIGSRAIASRAIAGVYQGKLLFSLPGSSNAVKLGLEKLILPELVHLIQQLNQGNR